MGLNKSNNNNIVTNHNNKKMKELLQSVNTTNANMKEDTMQSIEDEYDNENIHDNNEDNNENGLSALLTTPIKQQSMNQTTNKNNDNDVAMSPSATNTVENK